MVPARDPAAVWACLGQYNRIDRQDTQGHFASAAGDDWPGDKVSQSVLSVPEGVDHRSCATERALRVPVRRRAKARRVR